MPNELSQPGMSETLLVNRALVRIGARPIVSLSAPLDDKSIAAQLLYPELRDALLRSLRWNFARVFVALSQLNTQPLGLAVLPDPEYLGQIQYTAQYLLPNDYLRLAAVSPFSAHWRIVGNTLYTDVSPPSSTIPNSQLVGGQPLGANGAASQPQQNVLSGTTAPIGIEYIARIVDTTRFDPLFARCLTLALARDLCFGTTALESLRQQLAVEYKGVFDEARAIEGMEQWPEQLFDTVLVDVRMGYSPSGGTSQSLFGS